MSRKYRQRGYQDEEPRGGGRGGKRPPREPRQGPRGRGLGKPQASVFRCARCGERIPLAEAPAVDALCPSCGSALHSCTNCIHFDTGAPNQCRQPVVEKIGRKADANRCELFSPKITQEFGTEQVTPDEARAAFDALFKI